MKFRNFLGVSRTTQQAYFKEGVELIYPDQNRPLQIAILPSYDPKNPDPIGWIPAVVGDEESDFYTTVRAAKFVGHGNRRAKTSFLSPKTFDINADDPYDSFYEYCSRSDRWSYLTKDRRGKKLTGEVEGAIIPRMKNFFVANVIDMSVGSRGGVFVTELSETVAKGILYSLRKNGSRVDGIAFQKDGDKLVFGDITDPRQALVIEIVWGGKGYVARPVLDRNNQIVRTEIPTTLLQHRKHMEEPGTFIVRPESGQEIVDRLADMLRGYKSESGEDEIDALKEAIESVYGKGFYTVNDKKVGIPEDPFSDAAETVVESKPEEKAEAVDAAIERGVEHEKYTPVNKVKAKNSKNAKKDKTDNNESENSENNPELLSPGEDIDPSDIASVRAMLSGRG